MVHFIESVALYQNRFKNAVPYMQVMII